MCSHVLENDWGLSETFQSQSSHLGFHQGAHLCKAIACDLLVSPEPIGTRKPSWLVTVRRQVRTADSQLMHLDAHLKQHVFERTHLSVVLEGSQARSFVVCASSLLNDVGYQLHEGVSFSMQQYEQGSSYPACNQTRGYHTSIGSRRFARSRNY